MLTWNVYDNGDPKEPYAEGVCLSSDAKPTAGIVNGSKLIEMDTSKIYIFDEVNATWREF